MVSCLFRIVPLQENDSCSEIAMDDAAIAVVVKLEHHVVDDNLMLRFPILVSTVVIFIFLNLETISMTITRQFNFVE